MRKPIDKTETPKLSTEELIEWEAANTPLKNDNSLNGQEIKFWLKDENKVNSEDLMSESSGNIEEVDSFRYVVLKGANPHSRFHRIVLSNTMLSDHNCGPYGQGIVNAMQWS